MFAVVLSIRHNRREFFSLHAKERSLEWTRPNVKTRCSVRSSALGRFKLNCKICLRRSSVSSIRNVILQQTLRKHMKYYTDVLEAQSAPVLANVAFTFMNI